MYISITFVLSHEIETQFITYCNAPLPQCCVTSKGGPCNPPSPPIPLGGCHADSSNGYFCDSTSDSTASTNYPCYCNHGNPSPAPTGCTVPPLPAHTHGCGSTLANGQECTASCDKGYTMVSGDYLYSCQDNVLEPSSIDLKCAQIVPCQIPTLPANTTGCGGSGGSLADGTTCMVSCDPGYDSTGDGTYTCSSDGVLSPKNIDYTLKCTKTIQPCTIPALPSHSSGCNSSLSDGKSCTVTCDKGYKSSGDGTYKCSSDGVLSPEKINLKCTEAICSAIPAFGLNHYTGGIGDNACTSKEVLVNGKDCTVACASEYVPDKGTTEYMCGNDGSLTAPTLVCKIQSCPAIPPFAANIVGGDTKPCTSKEVLTDGETCNVECSKRSTKSGGVPQYSCSGGTLTGGTLQCSLPSPSPKPSPIPSPVPASVPSPSPPPRTPTPTPTPTPTVTPSSPSPSSSNNHPAGNVLLIKIVLFAGSPLLLCALLVKCCGFDFRINKSKNDDEKQLLQNSLLPNPILSATGNTSANTLETGNIRTRRLLSSSSKSNDTILTEADKQILTRVIQRKRNVQSGISYGTRFVGSVNKMITGKRESAAANLSDYMKIDRKELQRITARNTEDVLEAIRQEVEQVTRSQDTKKEEMTLKDWYHYVMNEKASMKIFRNGKRDEGHEGKSFHDFCNDPVAKQCRLDKEHICALRLYTTHAYRFINDPLRNGQKHPMPVTTHLIEQALKSLRQLTAGNESSLSTCLWRGFKNLELQSGFLNGGGTELAPMSTSKLLKVAADYSCKGEVGETALIMKLSIPKNGFMNYGADLKWISAFPAEDEICYPPLTFLNPTFSGQIAKKEEFLLEGIHFTVIEVRPSI